MAENLIDQLAGAGIPRLRVFNKSDLLDDEQKEMLGYEQDNLFISAKEGSGIPELLARLDELTEASRY